jgi:hypothetical protein
MTRSEIALLLGAIAGRDQRTIGEADVLAWHEDLGDLDFEQARAAVSRHFRETEARIMPAHIRRHVRVIRDENRRAAEVREIPSRFEDDDDRNDRIRRNIAQIRADLAEMAARLSVPDEPQPQEITRSDEIRLRALDRARAERQNPRIQEAS